MVKTSRLAFSLFVLISLLTIILVNVISQEEKPFQEAVIGSTVQLEESGLKLANLTLVEHTSTCLTDCKSVVEFVPLRDFTYDFDTVTKYYVNGSKSNGVNKLQFNFYKKVEKIRPINTYYTECTPVNHENGSTSDVCTTNKNGYYNYTYTEYEALEFNGLKSFEQGEVYRMVIELSRKPQLGPNYADWRLNFNGFEVPWAWVITDMPYRMAIQINNSANEILRKYHTIEVSGINTTDITRWNLTNKNSFAVVCDEQEIDKLIGNETEIMTNSLNKQYPESTGFGTNNMTLLFRLPQNITSNSINNTMCYLYYGNLTSNSTKNNLSNIFLFYDDFNRLDGSVLGNNWNETNNDQWAIANGCAYTPNGAIGSYAWNDLKAGQLYDLDRYELNTLINQSNCIDNDLNCNGYMIRIDNAPQNFTNVEAGQYDKSTGFKYARLQTEGTDAYRVVLNATDVNLKGKSITYTRGDYPIRVIAYNDRTNGDWVSFLNGSRDIYNAENATHPIADGGGNKKGLVITGRMWGGACIKYIIIKRFVEPDPTITFGSEETNNIKPNTPDIVYNVSTAYNFTNLNCSTATGISDPDGDNLTVFFNLTVDGLNKAEQILTNQSNGSRPSWQIDHHNYSKNQTVRCNITLYDGALYSTTNSTNITISNYVPVVENFTATNGTLIYGDNASIIYDEDNNITFSVNISDQDTSDSHWYSWFVDGTLESLTQLNLFSRFFNFITNGMHVVKVVINDSSNDNVNQTWNVTILNVVNRFFTVNFISPPTPNNGSILDSTTVNISVQIIPAVELAKDKTFTDDTESEFNLGSYANASFNTSASAIVLNKTLILEQIFNDSFESGSLNGWSVTGAGTVWSAIQAHPFEGVWSAKVNNTGNVNPTNMTRNISTVGFTSINVNYYRQLIEMEPSDEFHAEYDNGTSFIILELNNTVANDASYVFKSFNLSADVNENPNFRIRFLCKNNMAVEQCRLDNVKVNGLRNVFLKNGIFTSQIFNGTEILIWDNISWARTLPSGTNLTFQARSCDDSLCLGESFIGPDGTANTFYTNYLSQNLNVSNNTYLQYKAFFETTNINVTSQLSSVMIKGHTIVISSPTVEINSTIINFNGTNITMTGSGFFWSYVNTTLRHGNYSYIVYANDSFNNINLTEKRTFSVPSYNITFNVTDGETGNGLNGTTITCNYNGFSQGLDTTNAYGPYAFPVGNWQCTFVSDEKYDKTVVFTADGIKTINLELEKELSLTIQEHDWMRDLYNCVINGQCIAYKYWLGTNQTVEKIWNDHKQTDKSVVTQETFISYSLSSGQNISINYTLNIPFKEGYNNGELLPIRMFFWFTNLAKTRCFSQDKQNDSNRAESPYCIPLVAQTLGPNNGTVNFVVDLRPNLPTGTYNVTRSIDIDPIENHKPVWINYGREVIGGIDVLEDFVEIINPQNTGRVEAKGLNGFTEITGDVVDSLNDIGVRTSFTFLMALLIICVTLIVITSKYFKYKKLPPNF